jgi:hypothetical protein
MFPNSLTTVFKDIYLYSPFDQLQQLLELMSPDLALKEPMEDIVITSAGEFTNKVGKSRF